MSATVLTACTVTALPLVFGNYGGAELKVNSAVTALCTSTTPYNIGMDPGSAAGATVTTRQMSFLTNRLNYSLYRDSALTQNWGQTVGTDTQPGTGTGLPQLVTVYGDVPAGQAPAPGAYLDTVTVTLTY